MAPTMTTGTENGQERTLRERWTILASRNNGERAIEPTYNGSVLPGPIVPNIHEYGF
jgi:hypothetical protein